MTNAPGEPGKNPFLFRERRHSFPNHVYHKYGDFFAEPRAVFRYVNEILQNTPINSP